MQSADRKIVSAICALPILVAVPLFWVMTAYVPQSQVRFTSLELMASSGTGCVVSSRCLHIGMEFDSRFEILLPAIEVPKESRTPLSFPAKLKCLQQDIGCRGNSPAGLGLVSIPLGTSSHCQLLVDSETTYNVVPGMPLPVATFVDENGVDQTVYVAARSNN